MPVSDSGLLQAAKRGDERSFLELYERHRTPLFRFAWRMTGSVTAADDVIQECFTAILSASGFDGDQGSLRAYLFGITRHHALRRMRISEREAEEQEERAGSVGPLEELLNAERSEIVGRAVSALPPLQREAV